MGCSLLLSGCSSVHYLYQAGKGQWSLIHHARPISEVLKDERTPPRVRALLSEIQPIKKFAEGEGMKPTQNYTEYVQLDRHAAVWVVSACEPLRFRPKQWAFPLIGSFPYLGWFDRKEAEEHSEELGKEGLDVDLRGAGAYSTLGWFRDAVLSTMIPNGEEALGELVNVVLHESVHATLYLKGQAPFNESLASFMAERLTPRYLEKTRGAQSQSLEAYLESERRSKEIQKSFHQAYHQLEALYGSSKSEAEKRDDKKSLLEKLKKDLNFKREINNATLIQFKTYSSGEGDFESLYQRCNSNGSQFMNALKDLTLESFQMPHQEDFGPVLRKLNCTRGGRS